MFNYPNLIVHFHSGFMMISRCHTTPVFLSESEAFENVNAANLAGLLWYLEHEVVFPQCPRHYNITRILRCLVWMIDDDC